MTAVYTKEIKPMKNNSELLCPKCQRGKESYMLDNRSPFCPYINCHSGNECAMFKELDNSDRE